MFFWYFLHTSLDISFIISINKVSPSTYGIYMCGAKTHQAQDIFPHWRERCLTQGVFAQMDAVGHQSATHVLTASYCGHQSGLGILH